MSVCQSGAKRERETWASDWRARGPEDRGAALRCRSVSVSVLGNSSATGTAGPELEPCLNPRFRLPSFLCSPHFRLVCTVQCTKDTPRTKKGLVPFFFFFFFFSTLTRIPCSVRIQRNSP